MTFQELADKIQSGQTLSDSEQKEFFSLLGEESMKFKKEQPEKYLEFLKELNTIVRDLTKDLKDARAKLKA